MARPDLRQKPRLESLETRQVLSSGGPTADAQYMLELVNLARTDPAKAADVVTSNLNGDQQATIDFYKVDLNQVKADIASAPVQPPLALSDQLSQAATAQSTDQINMGQQTHTGSDGSNSATRIARTGYTDTTKTGENSYAYSDSVDDAVKAFLIDWGVAGSPHRNTIQEPATPADNTYREVGFGIVPTNKPGIGPLVITQNFAAKKDALPILLGVAYDDKSKNQLYTPGEGTAGVTVSATNLATGETKATQTQSAGGYQIELTPGTYKVLAKVGDQVIQATNTTIGGDNVKIDIITTNARLGGTESAAVTVPTPVVAPPVVSTPPVVVTPVSIPLRSNPANISAVVVSTPAAVPVSTPAVTPSATPVAVATLDPTSVAVVTPTSLSNRTEDRTPLVASIPLDTTSQPGVGFDITWVRSWKQWMVDKKKS